MGKRKLDVMRGEKPSNVEVCFSKRRQGLFKKASELCLLTHAQIAIITISPHGNPFVFGNSSVMDHFLNGTTVDYDDTNSDHHIARLVQGIEGRNEDLLQEKKKKKNVVISDEGEENTDDWFKIDEADRSDLGRLQCLRDEWMKVREEITQRLRTASSSSSGNSELAIASSSSMYNYNGNGSGGEDDWLEGIWNEDSGLGFNVDKLRTTSFSASMANFELASSSSSASMWNSELASSSSTDDCNGGFGNRGLDDSNGGGGNRGFDADGVDETDWLQQLLDDGFTADCNGGLDDSNGGLDDDVDWLQPMLDDGFTADQLQLLLDEDCC